MNKYQSLPKLAYTLGFALFAAATTQAASISFQTPTAITNDTALDAAWNNGTNNLEQAVSFGLTATVTTTGGQTIAFTSGADVGDFDIPAPSTTGAGIHNGNLQNDTYASTTGNVNFDTVLGSNAWHSNASDDTRPLALRIGNLTPGKNYVVSLFTVDDRAGSAGRSQAYWAGFSSGAFSGNTSGSFSQTSPTMVTATFIADASGYQDIFIEETDGVGNADTHFAAYTLYTTPEFTHPCIPTTLEELKTIKANLDKEPWKTGYEGLADASTSQLSWSPEGPWAEVGRTPDVNLTPWKHDMVAIYNLSLMWYFTGNTDYAQKAHDLLIAWATTHTAFTGQEIPLSIGDYAIAYAGGASILRGTWPGWTAADTATVKNYFLNVYWPRSLAGFETTGPANKGMIYLQAGMAISAFLDDTEKFNHCIEVYRANPASGLRNTLAIGEMGETGRDQGHAYGTLLGMTMISEIAWKQGIDLYSEMDNRLLAVGEYYARNSLGLNNPFVPFGTIDSLYGANNSYYFNPDNAAFLIIRNAYKNRKNLPTPWIDRKLESLGGGGNLMYSKTADFTTANPAAAISFPEVSPASSGLTLTTLGGQTAGRSASYSNGVWTVSGLGSGAWTDGADDGQFVYKAMTGDCALVAKITSATYSGSQNGKHALMIRDNLVGDISQRAWIGLVPTQAGGYLLESHFRGWTDIWGGSNRDDISHDFVYGVPYWLKIERRGSIINAYTSRDGTSWSVRLNGNFANLPSTVYIGLFVCSGNATPNTTTWSDVAFTGGTGGQITTPAAPESMLASGSTKAITARWLASYGATGYDVLRSTTSGSGYTVIASDLPADKTSYADTTASLGTTYYYVARAKNSAGTSGNSPEFSAALLPVEMVNLAITGTANDDQNNPDNAANAFDQDNGSLWFHGGGATGWLKYDFGAGSAQVVKRYTVNSANLIPERDPKDWQFQASNDGTNWTTLDTQTNQTFTNRMERNTYDISNTTAYRYYRFNVTANNGHPDILHIGDIGLWNDSGRTIPDGDYAIANRYSNKVMTTLNGGTSNGTKCVQWGYNGGDDQKWTFTHLGNGQYKVTGLASDRVMDVEGISTANGAQIHLWDWADGNNQKWTVTPAGDGYFKITAVHSGKVADVSGASTADGATIIQWPYNGDDNQEWLISTTY